MFLGISGLLVDMTGMRPTIKHEGRAPGWGVRVAYGGHNQPNGMRTRQGQSGVALVSEVRRVL